MGGGKPNMGAQIHIHLTLRRFTNGEPVVEAEGKTVGECVKNLIRKYPDMESSILDKKGDLLKIVEIYVNGESAYPNELAKPIRDGDQIHLTLMLAGG
jgi:molybdopterin converting factor small subunit